MRISCCKDCKERYPACHDHCLKYQSEVASEKASIEKYRKDNVGNNQLKQMYSLKKEKRMRKYKNDLW